MHNEFGELEDVKEDCGFELLVSDNLEITPPPTAEELRVLREEVDPDGYIIGR